MFLWNSDHRELMLEHIRSSNALNQRKTVMLAAKMGRQKTFNVPRKSPEIHTVWLSAKELRRTDILKNKKTFKALRMLPEIQNALGVIKLQTYQNEQDSLERRLRVNVVAGLFGKPGTSFTDMSRDALYEHVKSLSLKKTFELVELCREETKRNCRAIETSMYVLMTAIDKYTRYLKSYPPLSYSEAMYPGLDEAQQKILKELNEEWAKIVGRILINTDPERIEQSIYDHDRLDGLNYLSVTAEYLAFSLCLFASLYCIYNLFSEQHVMLTNAGFGFGAFAAALLCCWMVKLSSDQCGNGYYTQYVKNFVLDIDSKNFQEKLTQWQNIVKTKMDASLAKHKANNNVAEKNAATDLAPATTVSFGPEKQWQKDLEDSQTLINEIKKLRPKK